jgi:hypothetical protein
MFQGEIWDEKESEDDRTYLNSVFAPIQWLW